MKQIRLYNNRPALWQWDVDQKIVIDNAMATNIEGASAVSGETYYLYGTISYICA